MVSDLRDIRVIITSGPTRANLDPVRFVSNRSSGRLGSRIAVEALRSGADVTLVAGPDSVIPRQADLEPGMWERLRMLPVETVEDLLGVLKTELTGKPAYHAMLHAMAVLDYVPEETATHKVRSGEEQWTLHLKRTPKVIQRIKEWSPDVTLVGFKLEVNLEDSELLAAGRESMRKNRADLVVANDLARIRDEIHPALIIGPKGNVLDRPGTKTELARSLCRLLGQHFSSIDA